MQTREQRRAQKAFECIDWIKKNKSEDEQRKYGNLCLYFPAFVHNCGLCQAVAFYESKYGNKKPKEYYQRFLNDIFIVATDNGDWTRIRTMDVQEYQYLTKEIMVVANWFKRYAEAWLKVELGSNDNGNSSNSTGNSQQEGK